MVALAEKCQTGELGAEIAFVGSDRDDAKGLDKARDMELPVYVSSYAKLGRKKAEEALIAKLKAERVEWVILAGFMRILSRDFVESFSHRIINIHPSILPSFPGTDSIQQAWEYGVKVTGVTVHIVDSKVDHGPILAQIPVMVGSEDTLETVETAIHEAEHQIYWKTLRDLFESTQVSIKGRRLNFDC